MSGSKDNNPSIGLGLWGPLIPANDCKVCLGTLAAVQAFAGSRMLMYRRFTQRTWPRQLWRIGECTGGLYLMLAASLEFVRLSMAYDPWVEDARKARQRDIEKRHGVLTHRLPTAPSWQNWQNWNSWQNLQTYIDWRLWRYWWFGPSDYKPVSFSVWKQRAISHIERAEAAKMSAENLYSIQESIASHNMAVAANIHELIKQGKFDAPQPPTGFVHIESGVVEDGEFSDEEIFDSLDMSSTDLWELFDEPRAFSMVVLPRSSPVFIPNAKPLLFDEKHSTQSVNYAPIPQYVKRF